MKFAPLVQAAARNPAAKKLPALNVKGPVRPWFPTVFFQLAQTCSRCHGEGAMVQSPCPDCHGEGRSKVTRKIKVKIPAGVDSGSHLRFAAKVRLEHPAGAIYMSL